MSNEITAGPTEKSVILQNAIAAALGNNNKTKDILEKGNIFSLTFYRKPESYFFVFNY